MTTTRKTVVFSRHGKKKKGRPKENVDAITRASLDSMYNTTGVPLQNDLTPEQVYLMRSDKFRTLETGGAIATGALGLALPRTSKGFERLVRTGLAIDVDTRLGYGGLQFDMDAFAEDPQAYVAWMMDHKNATKYGNKEVTPYAQILEVYKPFYL